MCQGLPEEFIKYFTHIKGLQFTEKPNYKYLKNLFINKVNEINKNDVNLPKKRCQNCFDWCSQNCTIDFAPFFKKE